MVGVVPTPALAYLAGSGPFAAGIMVSASHNPADDNGLKVLDGDGLKLDDAVEDELEQLIWRSEDLGGATNAGARADRRPPRARRRLPPPPARRWPTSVRADGCALVLDAANGSGSALGPEILRATGATVEVIHAEPDGININVRSGATDPASLAEAVVERERRRRVRARRRRGPADRGRRRRARIVDGDHVLGILALDRLSPGRPAGRRGRLGPLERRAPGRSSRRPAARSSGRRSATSTSSRACRCRAPGSVARRAATSSISTTPRRATGSSPRSRSCG